jgi:large subunit ribosomal protein L25
MEMPILQAQPRDLKGRKNFALRIEGKVPAVVYGAGVKPLDIAVDRAILTRLFSTTGESTLIDLQVAGAKQGQPVLIQDLQYDPLRDEIIHADFRAVDMNKPIEAEVKLRFVGESAAIKGLGGTLVRSLESLKIRALPKDLISVIDVDISKLVTFDDAVHVADLAVPAGVEILEDGHVSVAVVMQPRSEEELAELNKAVEGDVSAVEVLAEKKETEEEAAEGAEPAAEPKKEEKKEEKKK